MVEERILVTGYVLYGSIDAGAPLEAVGLTKKGCFADRVEVDGTLRSAGVGEECRIFLSRESFSAIEGSAFFYSLVSPGSISFGSILTVSLDWATLKDEPLPAVHGFSPDVKSGTMERQVELRFANVRVSGVLKKGRKPVLPVASEEREIIFEHPLAIVPLCGFSMKIDGSFAAMGRVL